MAAMFTKNIAAIRRLAQLLWKVLPGAPRPGPD
ncbi:MAG: hypothetical protein V7635_2883 [Arthrobacter sp.]|jgi:hypothetical protein